MTLAFTQGTLNGVGEEEMNRVHMREKLIMIILSNSEITKASSRHYGNGTAVKLVEGALDEDGLYTSACKSVKK